MHRRNPRRRTLAPPCPAAGARRRRLPGRGHRARAALAGASMPRTAPAPPARRPRRRPKAPGRSLDDASRMANERLGDGRHRGRQGQEDGHHREIGHEAGVGTTSTDDEDDRYDADRSESARGKHGKRVRVGVFGDDREFDSFERLRPHRARARVHGRRDRRASSSCRRCSRSRSSSGTGCARRGC